MARKKQHAAEHPDERWLLTYADMITLLMALFMVLYAMSMVNKTKFEALRLTLKESFSGALLTGGSSILDHGAVSSSQTQAQSDLQGKDSAVPDAFAPAPQTEHQLEQGTIAQNASEARKAELVQESQLAKAKEKVEGAIRAAHLQNKATAFIDRRGLVIRLVTDQVLFGLGSYELRPAADPLLSHIAKAIEPLPNTVHIEGYTDSLPCSCSFGNNGLSFQRAQTVLDFMSTKGFTVGDRHDAVAIPYGERKPLAPNSRSTGNPRNRRVEIVILRNSFGSTSAGPLGNPIGAGAVSAASTPATP